MSNGPLPRTGGHRTHLDARLRILKLLTTGSAVGVFGTMILGSYTGAIGAGLACPDWPLCRGAIVPDFRQPGVAAEYAHRLFAAATSLLVLLTLVATLLWFRWDRRYVVLSVLSFLLLAGQVTLGMVTITSGLDSLVVTGHLALATTVFGTTLTLAVMSLTAGPKRPALAAAPA